MLIEWDDSFSVDSGIIDEQHKKLIEILNATFRCLKSGRSRECDRDVILKSLQDYSDYHFVVEEGLMRDTGFPRLEQHILEHQNYRVKLQEFATASSKGHAESMIAMLTFLDKWLIAHIINSDKRFAHFLREKSET